MRLIRVVGAALLVSAALAGPVLAGAVAADLSVTKTDSPDPVTPGSNITYTITLANAPSALTAVNTEVTDALPPGTTFVSLSAPGGWTATTPPAGGTGTVTITNPSVTAGSSHVFTLVVQVDANFKPGIVTNTASATTTTNETNTTNNAGTTTTDVVQAATSTPAASLADAATSPPAGSPLAILGFAVLLAGALSATAVLAVRRARS